VTNEFKTVGLTICEQITVFDELFASLQFMVDGRFTELSIAKIATVFA
jgi:hypothetical protein